MTAFEQAITELEIYGFTLVPNVLNSNQVDVLKTKLVRCSEDTGVHGYENRNAASILVANLPTKDPVFFQVIDHPVILPILEHFLDETLILGSLSSRIVRPGDGEQDFHSDIPAHMLNPVSPVMMNTVWMLEDFDILKYVQLKDPRRAFPTSWKEKKLSEQNYVDAVDGKPLNLGQHQL